MKASQTFGFETFNSSFFTIECFQPPASTQIKIRVQAMTMDGICKQSDSDLWLILFQKEILSIWCLLETIEHQFCDLCLFSPLQTLSDKCLHFPCIGKITIVISCVIYISFRVLICTTDITSLTLQPIVPIELVSLAIGLINFC